MSERGAILNIGAGGAGIVWLCMRRAQSSRQRMGSNNESVSLV